MPTLDEVLKKEQEEKEEISKKLRSHPRYKKITEEEYRAGVSKVFLKSAEEEQRRNEEKLSVVLAKIGLREEDLSLEWDAIKPQFSDGIKAVNALRPAIERGYGLIFLWGTWGQAKTLAGKILVSQAYRLGKAAAYANFMTVMDDIRLAYDEQESKMGELIRRVNWWTSRDVLFIDEFDKSSETAWVRERKFQIIDTCYQRAIREEALTVIASNEGDQELDGYIRSRLSDNRVGPIVHLHGNDARQVMPEGWKF